MNKFPDIATKPTRLALSLAIIVTLAACGGHSTPPPVQVATADVVVGAVNITPTQKTQTATTLVAATTTAAAAAPITFPTGFSGTNATGQAVALPVVATQVSFATNTADATQPKFAIVSGTDHFEGLTVMGSCSFGIQTSTYSPPSPFAVGQTFKVDPCTVTIPTGGKPADGSVNAGNVVVNFGGKQSTVSKPIVVNGDGTITVSGTGISGVTVTVTIITGA